MSVRVEARLPLPQVAATDFGPDEAAMVSYRQAGTRRALALDNRGPVRLDSNGRLAPDILDYSAALAFDHVWH